MLFDYLALAFFILFLQETEKKRKIEKMKQKRWQEKHRQFMFLSTVLMSGTEISLIQTLDALRHFYVVYLLDFQYDVLTVSLQY
jgi:hypothetical protein